MQVQACRKAGLPGAGDQAFEGVNPEGASPVKQPGRGETGSKTSRGWENLKAYRKRVRQTRARFVAPFLRERRGGANSMGGAEGSDRKSAICDSRLALAWELRRGVQLQERMGVGLRVWMPGGDRIDPRVESTRFHSAQPRRGMAEPMTGRFGDRLVPLKQG